jgi:hypothetical protein
MLAGAVHGAAARLKEKIFKIAAHMLEASVSDLELVGGQVRVKGVPSSSVSLADIGMRAYCFKLDLPLELESGLEGTFTYDHPYTTKPHDDRKDLGVFYPIMGHAAHLVAVEVDIETGAVLFKKYVAVHDVGTVLNPRSLQGQICGGIAQGIGLALLEEVRYGPDGQNLTSTFVDYLLPSASDVPAIEVYHQETPSPFTAYGVKDGGEAGAWWRRQRSRAPSKMPSDPSGSALTRCRSLPRRLSAGSRRPRAAARGRATEATTLPPQAARSKTSGCLLFRLALHSVPLRRHCICSCRRKWPSSPVADVASVARSPWPTPEPALGWRWPLALWPPLKKRAGWSATSVARP